MEGLRKVSNWLWWRHARRSRENLLVSRRPFRNGAPVPVPARHASRRSSLCARPVSSVTLRKRPFVDAHVLWALVIPRRVAVVLRRKSALVSVVVPIPLGLAVSMRLAADVVALAISGRALVAVPAVLPEVISSWAIASGFLVLGRLPRVVRRLPDVLGLPQLDGEALAGAASAPAIDRALLLARFDLGLPPFNEAE